MVAHFVTLALHGGCKIECHILGLCCLCFLCALALVLRFNRVLCRLHDKSSFARDVH